MPSIANLPIATLFDPVVMKKRAESPIAVLSNAVVELCSARVPTPTLRMPVVITAIAESPIAVLREFEAKKPGVE